jgi:hypothetical protein
MDYDGRDELYLAATNNTKEFEGGTLIVLDDTCRHGAALDSASAHHRFSNTSLPDSCRVRVVFPAFPLEFTNLLETPRMDAYDLLTHSNPEVSDRLTLNMGQPGKNLIVSFDEEIRPFSAYPTDLLAKLNSCWLDSTQVSLNYLGEDYLDQWLDNHHRFEAGHWSSQ